MVSIQSNGSRWAGQEPATLAELIEVLGREPLDPTFEQYGNFVMIDEPTLRGEIIPCRLFGNFANLSHVFNIDGEVHELQPVIDAIRRNQQSEGYRTAKSR